MSSLVIPNAVANGLPADGNELDANFDAIQAWADASVIESASPWLVPTGAVLPFAGSTAPSGFLLADGSEVNRTTYADLFTLIGTTYGAGDGVTTFNLPNLKGRFPVGRDAAVTPHDALGETGGSRDAVNVSHNHTYENESFTTVEVDKTGNPATQEVLSWDVTNNTSSTSTDGSSGTSANLPPYLTLNFVIKT